MTEKKRRPKSVKSDTVRVESGCGNLYITISVLDGKVFEVFATLGKAGGCAICFLQSLTTQATKRMREGTDAGICAKDLIGQRCPSPSWDDGVQYLSCVDAIGQILKKKAEELKDEQGS